MQRVQQLGYVGFGVSDMDAWSSFATDLLGLEAEGCDSETQRFRMDEYRNRLLVTRDDRDDITVAGWEVADKAALDAFGEQLAAAGVSVTAPGAEASAARRVTDLLSFEDPNGLACEVYYEIGRAHV